MPEQIKTTRLVLRAFTKDDGPAVVRCLADYEVSKWLAKVPHPFGPADLRLLKDDGSTRWPGLAAIARGGQVVGAVSSDPHLGYWIDPDHWGQGIASEAASAMVDHYFTRTSDGDLVSGYFIGNDGSRRVLEKLGFTETRRSVNACRARNTELPHVDMALTRATWEARV